MSRPWVIYNAQNRIVVRLSGGKTGPTRIPKHLEAAISAGLMTVQYRPRQATVKREFPYEGTGRL